VRVNFLTTTFEAQAMKTIVIFASGEGTNAENIISTLS